MTAAREVFKPHDYQAAAFWYIINNQGAGLFLDMGLGKTAVTLTAINYLMFERFEVPCGAVLVVAPKRVALHSWPKEVQKWEHLKRLSMSVISGTETQRVQALRKRADIYVVSVSNLAWLCALLRDRWPFKMVVLDELSCFKNSTSTRFKVMYKIRPFIDRIVGLTGTPNPNGYVDLWSQIYLLDKGERLGRDFTAFKKMYCSKNFNGFGYHVNEVCADAIKNKIKDICISMKAEDYLKLPPRTDITDEIELPADLMKTYKKFEREMILQVANEFGGDVTKIPAFNMGALYNKLLQFSNGAIYDGMKEVHHLHDEKLEALDEIVEVSTRPVMVFYSFEHDRDRILKRYKGAKTLKTGADIDAWNRGDIPILVLHPASAGHGLNLQEGGNTIVWFGLSWSLELYQQACARLHRQGQLWPVFIHHLVCKGTLDEVVAQRLEAKALTQDDLMEAVRARVKEILKVAA